MKLNFKKIRFLFFHSKFIYCAVSLILVLLIVNCNPIEAITDTFADVVDEVSSDGNDDNLVVGQILTQASFTSPGDIAVSVTVLSKAGSPIKDDTEIKCLFTEPSSGSFIEFNVQTVSGVNSCNLTNMGNPFPTTQTFVATVGGVSSNTLTYTLAGDGSSTT
jgi:hypothetical protein